ncbi:MAG: S1/P1 nuclease [Steroidobacteraceae bacterium]
MSLPRKSAPALLLLCASLLGAGPALAWGNEGHRIVALIAADGLSPAARAEVARLLGPDDRDADVRDAMEAVSTWADDIRRERPDTERWHFVDIEISAGGYDAARDCPDDDCVVAQIAKDERVVADVRLAGPERAEALRFLIHFVGDIHQPLHCADDHDRGGNAVRVAIGGEETNLHAVWDTKVVAALGHDPRAVAADLAARITPQERRAWSRGGPAAWANESFAIAKRDIFGPLHGAGESGELVALPDDYAVRERPVAARQLEKAGVRLAMVLNATFASPIGAGFPAGARRSPFSPGSALAGSGLSQPSAGRSRAGARSLGTSAPAVVTPSAVLAYVGQRVTVRGAVADVHITRAGVTFIDMGGRYPENTFTAVIFAANAARFPDVAALGGRAVEITGMVRLYRGKPEIVLRSPEQLETE